VFGPFVTLLVQLRYEALAWKALALDVLSDWALHVLPLSAASPWAVQVTYPRGIGISFASPGLNRKYVVKPRDQVI